MLRALFLHSIFKGSLQGTMQVSANISGVERGASETGSASSQVLSAAV
jgi:hypothetical protein